MAPSSYGEQLRADICVAITQCEMAETQQILAPAEIAAAMIAKYQSDLDIYNAKQRESRATH